MGTECTRPGTRRFLAIAFTVVLFGCIAANQWSTQLPIGSDGDEYLLVAKTFLSTGHFSVADIHATKYPPLTSSIAILFHYLTLNVPFAMIALNYLAILASALVLYSLIVRNGRPGIPYVLAIAYLLSSAVLWASASEILADALLFLLVSLALLLALRVDEWTTRQTLLAALLALLAVMCKSVGLVVVFPLAASLIFSHLRRRRAFPYAKVALLVLLPVSSLALYTTYQARFAPHPTGYAKTFLMNDPFDASRGSLTPLSFLWRTALGSVASLRDLQHLTISPPSTGVFALVGAVHPALAWLLASSAMVLVFLFALGRDAKRILVSSSLILPFMLVVCAWPFEDTRFVLPLLPIATLGMAGVLASSLRSRHRLLAVVPVLLLLSQITVNMIDLNKQARQRTHVRTHLNADVGEIVWWLGANVPEDEAIASPDYREIMLRLDRPVIPLTYSLDTRTHIAQLERADARWLVFCQHIYPLREVYARHVVTALGDRAALEYGNDSFLAYRIDPDRPRGDSMARRRPTSGSDGDR